MGTIRPTSSQIAGFASFHDTFGINYKDYKDAANLL